jgi:hypothetical protein
MPIFHLVASIAMSQEENDRAVTELQDAIARNDGAVHDLLQHGCALQRMKEDALIFNMMENMSTTNNHLTSFPCDS